MQDLRQITILLLSVLGLLASTGAGFAHAGSHVLGSDSPVHSGELVSLDVKGASLVEVSRTIATVADVSLVVDPEVRDSLVTVSLRDVPWEQALDLVVRPHGLVAERQGRVVRVALHSKLVQELTQQRQLREARELSEKLVSVAVPLSHADPQTAARILQAHLSPRGQIVVDERTRTLVIRDRASVVGEIVGAEAAIAGTPVRSPAQAPPLWPVQVSLHEAIDDDGTVRVGPARGSTVLRVGLDEIVDLPLRELAGIDPALDDVVLALAARRDGPRVVLTLREAAPGARVEPWFGELGRPHAVALPPSGGSGTAARQLLVLSPPEPSAS